MNADKQPIAIVEGCRLEIDGVEVLLVMVPFTSEQSAAAADQLVAIQKQIPVIFVARIGSRISIVANDHWKSRVSVELISKLRFSRIPIYRE